MDRFFIAYRISASHNKSQEMNNQETTGEKVNKKEQVIQSKESNNNKTSSQEKLVHDYITEWLYKSINSF